MKLKIDNYKLNKSYFENIKFSGFRPPTQIEKSILHDWIEQFCKLTARLDKYNLIYDLKETFINDNIYFCSLVDFIKYCFDITIWPEFFEKRVDFLLTQFLKVEKEINKIIEKKEGKNGVL